MSKASRRRQHRKRKRYRLKQLAQQVRDATAKLTGVGPIFKLRLKKGRSYTSMETMQSIADYLSNSSGGSGA